MRPLLQKGQSGADSTAYAEALAGLGSNLLRQQKWIEAEALLREALTIRQLKEPDVWTTFETKSMLGGALLGQKKYTEAEPLLLAGYEGLRQRQDKLLASSKTDLTDSLERLMQICDAVDRKDEAAKWRKALQAEKKQTEMNWDFGRSLAKLGSLVRFFTSEKFFQFHEGFS